MNFIKHLLEHLVDEIRYWMSQHQEASMVIGLLLLVTFWAIIDPPPANDDIPYPEPDAYLRGR
jgi:hypothetical protein